MHRFKLSEGLGSKFLFELVVLEFEGALDLRMEFIEACEKKRGYFDSEWSFDPLKDLGAGEFWSPDQAHRLWDDNLHGDIKHPFDLAYEYRRWSGRMVQSTEDVLEFVSGLPMIYLLATI
jgi:hypothetical protein